jgi:hypothetical protein
VSCVADVIRFKSSADFEAETNVRRFVDLCRNHLTVFGVGLPFDDNIWDISDSLQQTGKKPRLRIFFSIRTPPRRHGPGVPFQEPYLSFAKAYMRHEFPSRGQWFLDAGMQALRFVYKAMTEHTGIPRPSDVRSETLNRAVQMLDGVGLFRANEIAQELQRLAVFLVGNRLVTAPLDWRNPLERPGMAHSARVGKEFDELRARMLPSPQALTALARIFRMAKEPDDVLVSSIIAILCAAPSRIGEVLQLSADCEVVRNDSRGTPVYALRWYPEKGAPPQTKPMITSMVDVVREALTKIRALTKPARTVAAWYEHHPTELYLPPSLAHLREKSTIKVDEAAQIVFATPTKKNVIVRWAYLHTIKRRTPNRVGVPVAYAFADIEAAVVRMLPRGFPYVNKGIGLRYSDALFCYQRNLRDPVKPTYRGAIDLMATGDVQRSISGTKGRVTIFQRFGYVEKDGAPIRVRTHQLRHYLNTLAQAGGLSQLDIALWSGRANIHQNAVYDHVSDKDALAILDDNTQNDRHILPTLAAKRKAVLIKRDEFARLQIKTAHTTEFGFCVHDFAMLPCQLHMDCLNCYEHLCIKGDRVRNESLRQWRDETTKLLEHCRTAELAGVLGADRWTQHQTRTLTRVEEILEVYDDESVPNGAVIQPASGAVEASIVEEREGPLALKTMNPSDGNPPRLPAPQTP